MIFSRENQKVFRVRASSSISGFDSASVFVIKARLASNYRARKTFVPKPRITGYPSSPASSSRNDFRQKLKRDGKKRCGFLLRIATIQN